MLRNEEATYMSLTAILLSFIFVIIALFVSNAFKLGLGRDLIITSIRATLQLFIVGYILKVVFGFDNPIAVILMLLVMIFVAQKMQQSVGMDYRISLPKYLSRLPLLKSLRKHFIQDLKSFRQSLLILFRLAV